MMRAKPTITATTMTAIFHGSKRLTALSIWVTACIEENNMEKFNSSTKTIAHPESYLAQLSSAEKLHRMRQVGKDLLTLRAWQFKLSPIKVGCSRPCPVKILVSPRRKITQSPKISGPVTAHPHGKSFSFIFSQNFLCSNLPLLPHTHPKKKCRELLVDTTSLQEIDFRCSWLPT